jgi:hypothetical protein
LVISYRDTWTIPPWTVYALVLPAGFVPVYLRGRNQGYDHDTPLEIASSRDGRIFYYGIFYGADHPFVFHVELRLEENKKEFDKILQGSDAVKGNERFGGLRERVSRNALSSDFWFKLIDLAGKFL